ncbi:hypothetical protein BpHYR1_020119 [Brachionus plicatilis]|uniref:Uncharacterized protein n=1 Tax=Brachionus plicatilis TaxID=10195 RepID=A0A3M7RY52_BRAPC|nr:hypothetical protein BpHYR1_020119 [Brachionus plicatilis]
MHEITKKIISVYLKRKTLNHKTQVIQCCYDTWLSASKNNLPNLTLNYIDLFSSALFSCFFKITIKKPVELFSHSNIYYFKLIRHFMRKSWSYFFRRTTYESRSD